MFKSIMASALFLLIMLVPNTFASKSYGNIYNVIFVRNYDGDTITVSIPDYPPIIGDNISVRINGIDTPEMRGKCLKEKLLAKRAKTLTNKLLRSGSIKLYNIKRGKYFRIVADVFVDGHNVADILVENGLAVKYNGGHKNVDWCN